MTTIPSDGRGNWSARDGYLAPPHEPPRVAVVGSLGAAIIEGVLFIVFVGPHHDGRRKA